MTGVDWDRVERELQGSPEGAYFERERMETGSRGSARDSPVKQPSDLERLRDARVDPAGRF